jgi:hypothetical protein
MGNDRPKRRMLSGAAAGCSEALEFRGIWASAAGLLCFDIGQAYQDALTGDCLNVKLMAVLGNELSLTSFRIRC